MRVIGLTGGIGTGKSTVSQYLASKGFEIIDADLIARQLVMPGSPLLDEIGRTFGSRFILPDGSLDRKALGAYVFKDSRRKKQLDDIMMASIVSAVRDRIQNARNRVIVDAPLLFEAGLDADVEAVWLVDASDEVRITRVCARDNISAQQVADRIGNQMSQSEKAAKSDEIIDNSGSEEELYRQIDRLIKKYA
jgi:dephospho-CoA kinase